MHMSFTFRTLLLSTALSLVLLPATQGTAQTVDQPTEQRTAQTADQPTESDRASSRGIEEIVVTAQRRTESSLDVPMGLTALSGDQLQSRQAYRLEDFVGKVPGLSITETTGAQLVIRGIASSSSSINAPVATYIDDTPLVGIGPFSGGSVNTPNLDTFDVARVEVLKGPQGTLYGASALGGVLKYVTNAPDPSGFAAKAQGGLSSVAHSDDLGHNLRGMINLPLAENLAFRVTGYHNEYAGYIDDPQRGAEDINGMRIYGGRSALLWTPTADLAIRLSVLDQQRRWDGTNFVEVNADALTPLTCIRCQTRDVDTPGESRLRLYNGTVNWSLGEVELISSTTYNKWRFRQFDNLVALGFLGDALKGEPGSGNWGILVDFDYSGDEVVHETRLASITEKSWSWQVGIYYTDKDTAQNQVYLPIYRPDRTVESVEYGGSLQPATYEELAAFGNLNFRITPEFDISVGGRFSDQSQTFEQIGRIVAPSAPLATTDDTVFTFSTDARWRFTPDSMVYARVASGFVPGGPNVAPLDAIDIPPTFGSSTTTNYELGVKSALFDKSLTVEIGVFQIDWKDIQLSQQFGIYNAIANGGTAVSRGVEWAFNYVPVEGLTLGFTGAYTDAHLTEDPPAGVAGFDDNRLPVTPRWQLAGSADYRWPIFGVSGFVGTDWRYSGDRFANLTTSPSTRQQMPGYHIVDVRTGVETERWTLSLYAKNVGDTRAISYLTQETGAAFFRAYLTTPRTVGIDLSVNF